VLAHPEKRPPGNEGWSIKRDSSANCDRVSRTPANARAGVRAGPRAERESVAKRSQRIDARPTEIRKADRSHASGPPSSSEHKGESHATSASAGMHLQFRREAG
jgi:hypothetical protein